MDSSRLPREELHGFAFGSALPPKFNPGDIMNSQANGFELGAWIYTAIVFLAGMTVGAVFF